MGSGLRLQRWPEFRRRYFAELNANPATQTLCDLVEAGPVTLIYGARDEIHNQAVALEIGQQTFRVYSGAEFALLVLLMVLGVWSKARGRWYLSLTVPGAIILTQAFWLVPALDLRVSAVQAGLSPLPQSNLHMTYIVAEVIKLLWLLIIGLGESFLGARELVVSHDDLANERAPIRVRRALWS